MLLSHFASFGHFRSPSHSTIRLSKVNDCNNLITYSEEVGFIAQKIWTVKFFLHQCISFMEINDNLLFLQTLITYLPFNIEKNYS